MMNSCISIPVCRAPPCTLTKISSPSFSVLTEIARFWCPTAYNNDDHATQCKLYSVNRRSYLQGMPPKQPFQHFAKGCCNEFGYPHLSVLTMWKWDYWKCETKVLHPKENEGGRTLFIDYFTKRSMWTFASTRIKGLVSIFTRPTMAVRCIPFWSTMSTSFPASNSERYLVFPPGTPT